MDDVRIADIPQLTGMTPDQVANTITKAVSAELQSHIEEIAGDIFHRAATQQMGYTHLGNALKSMDNTDYDSLQRIVSEQMSEFASRVYDSFHNSEGLNLELNIYDLIQEG